MDTIKKATQGKMRWGIASVAAIALVAIAVGLIPMGADPNRAYAAAVERLRNAAIVSFTADWHFVEGEPPTRIEMAWLEPGFQRNAMELNGTQAIQVFDTESDKGIVLFPESKAYIKMELSSMPDVDRERINLLKFIREDMKSLPAEADEVLEEKSEDGTKLQGFRVGKRVIWIDVDAESLVSVEKDFGGTVMVMRDFRIDPDSLSETDFSTEAPEGWVSAMQGTISFDVSNPSEEDLIVFLRYISAMTITDEFPPTPNPLELLVLQKKGLLRETKQTTPEEEAEASRVYTQACQKSMAFIMGMRPENDWHYAGKGVKRGDAKTPIAWWKPSGSDAYRVIWGDLTVTDLAPGETPQPRQ